MLSLAKIAYNACSFEHKLWHKTELKSRSIKLEGCCTILLNSQPGKNLNCINYEANVCEIATKHGHLECLSYAHNIGFTYGNTVGLIAARYGHSECLQYAYKHGFIPNGDIILWDEISIARNFHAIINNMNKTIYINLTSLEKCYFYNKINDTVARGLPMGYCITDIAVKYGLMNILKFAHDNGSRWNVNKLCSLAVTSGQYSILVYCHKNGCRLNMDTCTVATKLGHFDIVKYAHENGCPLETNTCTLAANLGYYDILKYAHQNGCPLDKNTCLLAVKCNSVEMLLYARENGCPWNNRATSFATTHGILATVLPPKRRIIPARNRHPIKRYPM